MNLLDENVPDVQRILLLSWGIRVRQIGQDIGYKGLKDAEIPALLHRLRRATFFTLDADFYDRRLCHRGYCLVWMDVRQTDAAAFIRRLLRHAAFRTQVKRLGKVVHAHYLSVRMWRLHAEDEERVAW